MPTPLFKVLANSIRLGQPPEPVAAIKALVEVIAHQENELGELRQRLSLLQSRLQFLEAKTNRMEALSLAGAPATSHFAPEPQIVMPQPQPAPPQPASLQVPQHLPKAEPLPSRRDRPRTKLPASFREGGDGDDSQDEAGGTLVVARADIDAVVKRVVEHEAPFPLPPPGGHRGPDHLSDMPFRPAPAAPPQAPAPTSTRAPSVAPPPMAAREEAPREAEPRRVPDPRASISDPYVPIEELGSDDTFSSTAEVEAARVPVEPPPQVVLPRPSILDEPSFDEVLTSVHKRKP
jgi:hypothetical protein